MLLELLTDLRPFQASADRNLPPARRKTCAQYNSILQIYNPHYHSMSRNYVPAIAIITSEVHTR